MKNQINKDIANKGNVLASLLADRFYSDLQKKEIRAKRKGDVLFSVLQSQLQDKTIVISNSRK